MKAESVKAERPSVRSAVTVMLVVVLLLGLVVQGCKMLEKMFEKPKYTYQTETYQFLHSLEQAMQKRDGNGEGIIVFRIGDYDYVESEDIRVVLKTERQLLKGLDIQKRRKASEGTGYSVFTDDKEVKITYDDLKGNTSITDDTNILQEYYKVFETLLERVKGSSYSYDSYPAINMHREVFLSYDWVNAVERWDYYTLSGDSLVYSPTETGTDTTINVKKGVEEATRVQEENLSALWDAVNTDDFKEDEFMEQVNTLYETLHKGDVLRCTR